MAKSKKPKNSSDREKWNKVFNALVHMLKSQQTQLESLAKERMILEDRIKLQNDRWVSDIDRFQEQIYEVTLIFFLNFAFLLYLGFWFVGILGIFGIIGVFFFGKLGLQMRKEFTIQEMERMLEVAKSEFVVGLKQRDVAVFQRKFGELHLKKRNFSLP